MCQNIKGRERRSTPVLELLTFIQCASRSDEEHCSNKNERCTDHKGIERLRKSHGVPPSRLPSNDSHGCGFEESKIVAAVQLKIGKIILDHILSY
jgi:hypothetical protein